MCPTESDEMNVKRIARYLKGVTNAQCSIEINRFPPFVNVYSDSDRARQHQTCKNTSGGVTQWRSATHSAWSGTQQTVSLSSAEAELFVLTTGITEGMVTQHLSNELGYAVTLVEHVDSQSAKAWASKQGFATDETCNVEVHVRARRTGEEANDTCPCKTRHSDVRSGQNVS